MTPLALIAALAAFCLFGWGLFGWRLYRDGNRKAEMERVLKANASFAEALQKERRLFEEQIKLVQETGRVDADTLNGILGRLRGKG